MTAARVADYLQIDQVRCPPGADYTAKTICSVTRNKRSKARLMTRVEYSDGRVEVGFTMNGCEHFKMPYSMWRTGGEALWEELAPTAIEVDFGQSAT